MNLQPSMKVIKWVAPALGLVTFGVPLVASWLLALFLRLWPVEIVMQHIPVLNTLFTLLARPYGYWYYIIDATAAILSGVLLWYVWRTTPDR